MARIGVDFTTAPHLRACAIRLPQHHPWYVLMEISSGRSEDEARATTGGVLEHGTGARGHPMGRSPGTSFQQRADFWRLREGMSESQIPEGGSIKHDISVPVDSVPPFLAEADRAVLAIEPGSRICAFGHLGDGNIHYNIPSRSAPTSKVFLTLTEVITPGGARHRAPHGGSISAEHGIGQMKRDELAERNRRLRST
jgi:FAD/FMN-containing dehydrogenase